MPIHAIHGMRPRAWTGWLWGREGGRPRDQRSTATWNSRLIWFTWHIFAWLGTHLVHCDLKNARLPLVQFLKWETSESLAGEPLTAKSLKMYLGQEGILWSYDILTSKLLNDPIPTGKHHHVEPNTRYPSWSRWRDHLQIANHKSLRKSHAGSHDKLQMRIHWSGDFFGSAISLFSLYLNIWVWEKERKEETESPRWNL